MRSVFLVGLAIGWASTLIAFKTAANVAACFDRAARPTGVGTRRQEVTRA